MGIETDKPASAGTGLSAEALPLIQDLFEPNAWIYWIDFAFCTVLGWTSFYLTLQFELFSFEQIAAYLVASLCLYRSVIFIHELSHLRAGTFKVFRIAWNLFAGFPLFVPSFSYMGVHLNHHKRNAYGRNQDGEYLPFIAKGRLFILWYLFIGILLPLLFCIRCIILTPLTFFHSGLRSWVWIHLSSLAIDLNYERPEAKTEDQPTFRLQEIIAFLYGVVFISLIAFSIWPTSVLALWYCVGVTIFMLNSLRTLVAHRYANPGDRVMSIEEQYLDSIDISGNPVTTTLWAPVGLRYHATHHLFPSIPYHNLGKARRRLENCLKENRATYQKSLRPSIMVAMAELWKAAGEHHEMARSLLPLPKSLSKA